MGLGKAGLGIVAGSGALPRILADRCRAESRPYHVYGVEGFAGDWTEGHPGRRLSVWSLAELMESLRESGCGDVCLAGAVRRPSFAARPAEASGLSRLERAFREGDDSLLRAVSSVIEETGFRLVGVHDVMPDLLAPAGCIAGSDPTPGLQADVARAREIVMAMGQLDVGQAAVVAEGRCLGVEAVDGTDALLDRIAAMDEAARGGAARGAGVVVKAPKPQQDRRLDLPAIGPETVEGAARAGLKGVAIEAGGVLLVDREAIERVAESLEICVWAFPQD